MDQTETRLALLEHRVNLLERENEDRHAQNLRRIQSLSVWVRWGVGLIALLLIDRLLPLLGVLH